MKEAEGKKSKATNTSHISFEVYVDFIFDSGLIFIAVKNNSNNPVFKVNVSFNKKFSGVNGLKEISSSNLFKNIEFLAPQKEIKTFLDTSESYFIREQPTKISAKVSYRDIQNRKNEVVITHDLEIYRDIGFIIKNIK